MAAYAELNCWSNFTFLSAASHPEELIRTAARLGYRALALTDECSLAGVVRAHAEANAFGFKLLIGTEVAVEAGPRLILLAADASGYGNLSALISVARRRASKGSYRLLATDLDNGLPGCLAIWIADTEARLSDGGWLCERFAGRCWIGAALHRAGDDQGRLRGLQRLGGALELPLVAIGAVRMHAAERAPLLDLVRAIRAGVDVARGAAHRQNREQHLRTLEQLGRFYPEPLLAETLVVAERCQFSLDQLRYEYPEELVPAGETPDGYLRRMTFAGAGRRWPDGMPRVVRDQAEHELRLIAELGYAPYFLTVMDIVRFARSRGILCQGRGSAANSVVCYCLGITEVDPARIAMLFERFISRERGEPPDIDVDFEHHRREEVIQYLYNKYGRERAALAATVISYRPKSALRDVGKALGFSLDQVDRLARNINWWDGQQVAPERLREVGLDPTHPRVSMLLQLVHQLIGFPRHLSQHVGGFVISNGPLTRLVPIENAAMDGRSVIQWDKDDLDALGLLKVDCLALGMLSAIRRALDLINGFRGTALELASIPAEDPAVYRMIQRAETTGVFQIESRAQMAMLPRLKPVCFYDLVIEVAIVRPGPIQGDMVHPYLRRRQGLEPVSYPSAEVEQVLGRTLGVPIFQEQVIQVATFAAGFDPGEADQVRRSMAAWRRRGGLEPIRDRLIDGMIDRGYTRAFAEQLYHQILGFGEYGFPESHAASFALLVYCSAWLKHHEPAAFFAALINSQPMGFYAPAQLIREARRQQVEVRAVDVSASDWDCTLERTEDGVPALRLGLRLVKGLSRAGARRLVATRHERRWQSLADLRHRSGLDRRDMKALAVADALSGIAGHRHQAAWQATSRAEALPLLPPDEQAAALPLLSPPQEGEAIVADYASLGLSLRRHPLALLRPELDRLQLLTAQAVEQVAPGVRVRTAGLAITRQRPASANEVTFVTLEDETGQLNLVIWKRIAARRRAALLNARLLGAVGEVQRESGVTHLVVSELVDYSAMLGGLVIRVRDFH
ncbi:MAG: DNA polymerase III subunit alpha [Gammaproteobacteria bacterium]|nr:DNA polymerase III subunit alpha [Gammaproteobacteria bacterium]